jgi:predicted P-loop ATPase
VSDADERALFFFVGPKQQRSFRACPIFSATNMPQTLATYTGMPGGNSESSNTTEKQMVRALLLPAEHEEDAKFKTEVEKKRGPESVHGANQDSSCAKAAKKKQRYRQL